MNAGSPNAHRLLQLFEQLRDKRHGKTVMRLLELNLSFTHLRAMHVLAPNRTLAMKDIAEQLHLTPPSVTALTRRLVTSGMIQRQVDSADSRVALLSLTDDGQALLLEIYQDQLQQMDRLLQGLAPEEQALFLSLLERAVQTIGSCTEDQAESS